MAISWTDTASWSTSGTAGTNAAYKEVTVTVAVGDLVVAVGITADAGSGTSAIATQAGPGTTGAWTIGRTNTTSSNCGFTMGHATATGAGAITVRVTVPISTTSLPMGAGVWVIPAAEWTGTPAYTNLGPTDADGKVNVTLSATSIVLYGGGDWSAAGSPGTGTTPAGGVVDNVELVSGNYGVAAEHWTAQASGTRAYGPSAPPGNEFVGAVMSIDEAGGVSPEPIPVAFDGVGAWVAPASSATIAPTYPTSLNSTTTGVRLVAAVLVVKPDTATVATPANWTAAGSQAVGGGTQGAGTGAVKVFVFRRELAAGATLSGTETFTITGGSSPVAHIRSWSYDDTGYTSPTWESGLTSTFYSRTTASTTFGGTGAANLNLEAGDALMYVSASSDDQSATHTISALAATGATLSAVTQSPAGSIINAQGNDISAAAAYALVTAGPSSAAPSATVTGSSSETGGGVFWRVRATGTPVTGGPPALPIIVLAPRR